MAQDRSSPFQPPSDPDVRIWRYMDFTKYVAILQNRGVFFARATQLNDAFEGSYPRANEAYRDAAWARAEQQGVARDTLEKMLTSTSDFARWNRKWVLVSSWHMNEAESAAMWKLYAKSDDAVCIQSTYQRLKQSLGSDASLGVVQYIDYNANWIPEGNVFIPFLYKRRSYEHEQELRALLWKLPIRDGQIDRNAQPEDPGVWEHVDLGDLIEAVYVAPQSPPWFRDLVEGVTRQYGIEPPIIQSSLDESPFF